MGIVAFLLMFLSQPILPLSIACMHEKQCYAFLMSADKVAQCMLAFY